MEESYYIQSQKGCEYMLPIQIDLPKNFLEEEIRCGYKISSEMKKVWAVEMDMLYQLDQICRKYNIHYFASGGTMLGAVRHKGFIPWDDDIDIMMFREEYDKLCEVAPKELKYPYFFQTEYTDKGSLRGHAQIRNCKTTGILMSEKDKKYQFNQGIFVDVFPLDAIINDKKLFHRQFKRAMKYKKLAFQIAKLTTRYNSYTLQSKKKLFIFLLHYIIKLDFLHLFSSEKYYKKFEDECKRYDYMNTEMVSTLSLQFNNRQHFKYRSDYQDPIYMDFEFMQIPVSSQYDHALRVRYGEYMKFEKGTSYHGDALFDTEKPYSEYI